MIFNMSGEREILYGSSFKGSMWCSVLCWNSCCATLMVKSYILCVKKRREKSNASYSLMTPPRGIICSFTFIMKAFYIPLI